VLVAEMEVAEFRQMFRCVVWKEEEEEEEETRHV
jgi:hypothetical protein